MLASGTKGPIIDHLAVSTTSPKRHRYSWPFTVLLLLVLLWSACARENRPPEASLVLITVDTLRADHLGYYGYARNTSPNIDRLAAQSIVFETAVAQWPKTTPSFVSMLTGTYGVSNGVIRGCNQRAPDHLDLMAELLQGGGFATAAVVSNRFLGSLYNFDRGFDHFVEVWETGSDTADAVTDVALDWISEADTSRPFFLWLHYLDPHAPYTPPEPLNGMYVGDDEYRRGATVAFSDGDDDIGVVPTHAQIEQQFDVAYYVAQYDAEIRFVDTQVNRVLDALESSSLSSRTMVVFTADHGESLGDHDYFFEHGRLPYDACLRIPLMIRVPWLEHGEQTVRPPVELLNLLPTVLDTLGLPASEQAQGVSMLPLIEGEQQELPPHVFAEAGYAEDYQRIVREGPWKLVYVPDENDRKIMTGSRFELYDLENDPGELHNLASVRPDIVNRLSSKLMQWIETTPRADAPAPTPVPLDAETEGALRTLGYLD